MAKLIGRYEIREELGRGGMSTVYLAYDPKLHREVAVKLMDQQLAIDPAFAARFTREARTVAALDHSAIVALYDFGEYEGWLYLVMPYMKGGSLKQQIARGPLSPQRSYGVLRRIGSALDKAHNKDIIHRDLKPGNILLDEEREAYLSDFGIIKVAKGDTEYLTQTGQTIGTFAYMSPEQLMGEPIDGRSDLYALGVVLYEMLTGKHPYGDENTTDAAMAVAHTQKPIPDVTRDNPDLPPACKEIVFKALAKDADDRYSTGRDLTMDMYRALTTGTQAASASVATVAPTPTASQQPAPAAPVDEQPPTPPVTQQQAEQVVQEQPTPAANLVADTPPLTQAEISPAEALAVEAVQTEPPGGAAKKSPVTPLPHWIMVALGLVAIAAGAYYIIDPYRLIGDAYAIFYWPIIGLLTGASLLARPADWRWRLAVAILAIVNFPLAAITYDTYNLVPAGLVGILIGLIQIIQGFRGAGIAFSTLGVASAVLGGLMAYSIEDNVYGVVVALFGIATVALSLVRFRRSSSAG